MKLELLLVILSLGSCASEQCFQMSTFTVGNQIGMLVDDLDILQPAKDNRDLVIASSGEFNYAMRLNAIVVCMDLN